ncbi:hypothetical protein [Acetobacter cerevisiae]|uniref:hypothetical protein n=1 Tax=Acetobacter cerevisiae TaxID=178900 RepID=UPI00209FB5DD|nr:hypothetical protein [Acetobacter cerevisiae]MCP1271238.1 hypothetical protein [Acetobacter cerevisiae]MCP1279192.1 hypothetical protein [Acetobacter cerevisiae]
MPRLSFAQKRKELIMSELPETTDQSVDVGESGGDFPYWAAKEALKAAEAALAETDKSRESLGKTATSLIGWSLPLSVVLAGAVFTPTLTPTQRAAAAVAFLLTTAGVLAAFQVLRVRAWSNAGLSPSQWFGLIENPPAEASAFYVTMERLNSLDNALHKNDQLIELCAKHVGRAWFLLLSMPLAAFAAALVTAMIF